MKSELKKTLVTPRITHRMKYMQLVEFVNSQIESEILHINDRLPSLNQLTARLGMSKETVLKGLNYLSEKGIIESEYRKGYYVKKRAQYHPYRICLLLDKMNVLRDRIYHSFREVIKDQGDVDVYFHHHNFKVFEKLIEENLNNYTHFVLVTFFSEKATNVLNKIPPSKRIILDLHEKNLQGDYTCFYQDYKSDLVDSLTLLIPQLEKYKRLVLIAPPEAYHANSMIEGVDAFGKLYKKPYKVFAKIDEAIAEKGDAYITFSRYDQDDVAIIKIARKKGWKLGHDIGLISYNDTAIKEVLENGITVISTDFNKMGKDAALAILNKETVIMREPAKVMLRNSL